jgi:hypothetical protein
VKEVFSWCINVYSRAIKKREALGDVCGMAIFLSLLVGAKRFLPSRAAGFQQHGKVILFRSSQEAIKRHLKHFFCLAGIYEAQLQARRCIYFGHKRVCLIKNNAAEVHWRN